MKSMMMKHDDMEAGMPDPKGYFPSFRFKAGTIPEFEDKDVGDVCKICLKVKVRGITEDNMGKMINVDVLAGEYSEHEKSEGGEDY